MASEVLKYCNFDEITIKFSNNLLLNNEIPKQWLTWNIIQFPKYIHGQICWITLNYTALYQKVSEIIIWYIKRKRQLADHCIRHNNEIVHNMVIWSVKNGRRNRGRQSKTYLDILMNDCECDTTNELRTLVMYLVQIGKDFKIWSIENSINVSK